MLILSDDLYEEKIIVGAPSFGIAVNFELLKTELFNY